jgi:hypothetical protein
MALYDASFYLFGILTSELHMIWVKSVGGRLKTDYRYSAGLCYNTFPFIEVASTEKEMLEELSGEILSVREEYSDKSLSDLYDPDLMPEQLLLTHSNLDKYVDSLYGIKQGASEEDKLSILLTRYYQLVGGINA